MHLGFQAGLLHKPGVPGNVPTDLRQFAGGDYSCTFAFANAREKCVALCIHDKSSLIPFLPGPFLVGFGESEPRLGKEGRGSESSS